MRKRGKRILSLVLSATTALSYIPASASFVYADSEKAVSTVSVTVRSQAAGEYMTGINSQITVSSDEAENYGYKDSVADGVSALDALVAEHELIFGDEFSGESKNNYLAVSDAGYVSTIFGQETYSNGFFVNEGYPNDGTEYDGGGYIGTTVNQTVINDNDTIDFFIYGDSNYSDYYSFISTPDEISAGSKMEVTVSGQSAMYGYMYKDAEEFKNSASALEGVGLAWIDGDTGASTAIDDVATDENGKATITAPEEEGTYYLAASSSDDVYVLKNAAEVNVGPHAAELTVDQTSVTLDTGDSSNLSATASYVPEGTELSWSSSDEDVATVSQDGVVTAVDIGKAIITVSAGDLTASCKVKVIAPSIKLNNKSLEMDTDDTETLTATIKSSHKDASASWSSSNEKVASVDESGTVTAHKAGTAVITASYGEAEADCIITVFDVSKTTSLTITAQEDKVNPGNNTASNDVFACCGESGTIQLTAIGDDGNAAKVKWSSNNKSYPIDKNGLVTVTKSSNAAYVNFTATSKADKSVTASYYIYFLPEMSVRTKNLDIMIPEAGVASSTEYYVSFNTASYASYHLIDASVADDSVAEVDTSRGVCYVIPKKAGSTTITITNKLDPSKTATIALTVKGFMIKDEDGTKCKRDMAEGGTVNLSVDGASDLTWSSSNDNIASVDADGKVSALKEGQATISASDGSYTASYVITVKKADSIYPDRLYCTSTSGLYLDEALKQKESSKSEYVTETNQISAHWYDVTDTSVKEYYMAGGTGNASLNFGAIFDKDKVKVEIIKDGEVTATLTSANTKTVSISSGDNSFKIRVTSLENSDLYKDYEFLVHRASCSNGNLSSFAVRPENRNASSTKTYRGKAEASLFKASEDGTPTSSVGFNVNTYYYKSYVYSDVAGVTLTAKTADSSTGHLTYSLDNGASWVDSSATTTTDAAKLSEDGTATILVKSVSDAAYKAAKAAGSDPYADSKVYTVYVERVNEPDVKISSLSYSDGITEASPGFSPERAYAGALVDHDTDAVTLTFTAPIGVAVYKTSVSNSNLLTAESTDDSTGTATYKLTVSVPLKSQANMVTQRIYLSALDDDGYSYQNSYSIMFYKVGNTSGVLAGMPNKVVDYLCAGSQYTAGGNTAYGLYGILPEKSLMGGGNWNSCISLGNFGGYITYYYEDGIKDDSGNPYGIDLTVFGNSNGGTSFAEPGAVWVSEDGNTWYELAGSEHYDATAEWNYTVTYKQTNSQTADYEDSFGNSGTLGAAYAPLQFPEKQWYPLSDKYNEDATEVTVSGTRLYGPTGKKSSGIESVSGGAAACPAFGYADVHTNSSTTAGTGENVNLLTTPVGNPYTSNYNKYGDGFDLEWAVDSDGMPVDVSNMEFHYVKVVTSSFNNAGIFGEKSTEVNAVVKTQSSSEDYGKTESADVTIGATTLHVSDDRDVYYVTLAENQSYDVSVDTDLENVYINNQRTTKRSYEGLPDKGIFRIILQDGEKSPRIIYVKAVVQGQDAVADIEAAIDQLDSLIGEDLVKAVANISTAYEALSDEQKEEVSNLSVYEEKKSESAICNVENLLDKADSLDAIEEAFAAYEALDDTQKENIAAEEIVEKAIDMIGKVTENNLDSVDRVTALYEKLTDEEKTSVSNAQTLINAQDKESAIKQGKELSELRLLASTASLPESVIYSGKAKKPEVTVSYAGKTLELNKDYTLNYSNNTKVGTATVTITGKGDYSGSKTASFTILPKKVAVKSLKAKKKALTLKWKKAADGTVTRYEIQYSTSKSMKNAKTVKADKTKTSQVIKNLKSGKKYYVRIRASKTKSGQKYYSAWSKIKKVTVR